MQERSSNNFRDLRDKLHDLKRNKNALEVRMHEFEKKLRKSKEK